MINDDITKPLTRITSMDQIADLAEGCDAILSRALLDELSPIYAEHMERVVAQARRERLECIVAILFPTNYATNRRSGQTEAERPLIHPEKDWWWNGASMKDFEERTDGSAEVTVSSYVGGGESEDFTFNALREWIEAPDPTTLIQKWVRAKRAERSARKIADEASEAEHAIQEATATLARLKGAT